MLVFVFIAFAIFITYGINVMAVTKSETAEARLAALNLSNVLKNKSKVGVVKGIVYNPPNSCAVVDGTMVHVGDKIHDVVVVEINSNKVKFTKDAVTWQQAVQEAPHAAWPNVPTDSKRLSK
jgi:hypothetical protein